MDNLYLLMIVALAILAIADLVVGVSNDAVNFLNSAIGSKAVSFKTIMIVASIGIACGAIFSSGMMEVARKGIFNPGMFMFSDIMVIFMAVMITDILLLDFFNTLGMPTSTTVSIVFELLGAAVAVALIKIGADSGNFADVVTYINTEKATQIIFGILLSVVVAFSVGALVQYLSRLLLSFNFERKPNWVGALFGGIALTSIMYFILMKGIGGTNYAKQSFDFIGGETIKDFLEHYVFAIVGVNLIIWSALAYVLIAYFKTNIYKIIIIVGTFALALAFAGNDLVNFIGVPIAAWQSYEAWVSSGVPATEFAMTILGEKVPTPTVLLFIAGMVMVVTLWFSSKAKSVVKTSIDLSSQGETKERFEPNFLSRVLVRGSILTSKYFSVIVPNSLQEKIEKQFEKPVIELVQGKKHELPAFDLVRAAVNLMVAGVLISIATSYKLPLSTTYVTFMVAMGSSLADRAWGSESAVYRVAGVLNVIGGWFFTAISAFIASGVAAYLIYLGGATMIAILLLIAVALLIRNSLSHLKKSKEIKAEDSLNRAESKSVQGVIEESADNIAKVLKRVSKIQENTINGLIKQELPTLKKAKNTVGKLESEIEDLQNNIFYFIKNLDESSVSASTFYIDVIGDLQDIAQSVGFISKVSHKHIHNNHKGLKVNQAKELKEISEKLNHLFGKMREIFDTRSFNKIGAIIEEKKELLIDVSKCAQKQVERTRTTESSPKNTTLYFSILLETEDLIKATMSLLELYATKNKKK
ncbi:inorganic phosphate transporter [Lutibacter maritimus]|uniref:Phosphate transporter n=1 Tax=Lutibacter maritimus TaxID=593133 RepID=A0A1I6PIS0_9FLAO|nr:inorganic phosphate transporter [Lutibacter maritimus]SFS40104.1 Phosphate transporter family protein [Lutibacter maritimus]